MGGACFFLFINLALAQDLSRPLLLVAAPTLQGPYHETALIAVPSGDQHIGFILNRATDVKLASLLPDFKPSERVVDPVFVGGPEAADLLFAIVRHDPGEPSLHLFGDLFLTGDAGNIDRVIEQTPNEARYYVGFVGWMPEQLAEEIEKGFWYVGDADASLVFAANPEILWQDLLKRLRAPLGDPTATQAGVHARVEVARRDVTAR